MTWFISVAVITAAWFDVTRSQLAQAQPLKKSEYDALMSVYSSLGAEVST
jgi:hypothetical protein